MKRIKDKQQEVIRWINKADLFGEPQEVIDLIDEQMYMLADAGDYYLYNSDGSLKIYEYKVRWGALAYHIGNALELLNWRTQDSSCITFRALIKAYNYCE